MSSQPLERTVLDGSTRLLLIGAGVVCLGLLLVARRLEPDPRGYGTHAQLGLGPCSFASLTGQLCPTCGMTTAFAWFARGELVRAWVVHPAGCLTAAATVPLAAWLLATAVVGRPLGGRSAEWLLTGLVVSLVLLSLTFWILRLVGVAFDPRTTGAPPAAGPGSSGVRWMEGVGKG